MPLARVIQMRHSAALTKSPPLLPINSLDEMHVETAVDFL